MSNLVTGSDLDTDEFADYLEDLAEAIRADETGITDLYHTVDVAPEDAVEIGLQLSYMTQDPDLTRSPEFEK